MRLRATWCKPLSSASESEDRGISETCLTSCSTRSDENSPKTQRARRMCKASSGAQKRATAMHRSFKRARDDCGSCEVPTIANAIKPSATCFGAKSSARDARHVDAARKNSTSW
eukprot:CAMPEP_0179013230 /NCGR_PEP_ID=MMETSP0796-20121207/1617_1 /TAXON_ID=73915 /ORGANISM="Pyrodinium bahamense, Strain pbaha01" /LENGTH=113 /DNA_ID=CAMNT_0020708723 /DNA_START=468 /DNA_END=809 /DNA_ORIENTATION=-